MIQRSPWRSPQLAAESLIALIFASIAIRFLAFRRLAQSMPLTSEPPKPASEKIAANLRWALEGWSRRLPWRPKCFEQGLAAHWMLSRRRTASTLCYGAAVDSGSLKAHVWVRSGDLDVIGCENAGDFAILSQFSNAPSSSPVHS